MGCFNLIECLTQPRIYARASPSLPHRVAEISAVGLPWIDRYDFRLPWINRYDFLLKCDRPGTIPLSPPSHVTQKQEKETRQENYWTWVSKIKPISNIKPGEIHHWSQKQSNAFHAKYLKAPALLQSSFSSCAFESEQKIQLNGCKSRDPSIKLLRNYFFQVRELLLNAEWE